MTLIKMAKKTHFSKHQIETAVLVLMESAQVRKWVEGEARFLNIDLSTPQGKEFFQREARAAAERLIS